jgi:hypothetical protein
MLLYPEEIEIIRAIHATDWKLILTITGGGTRLLPALLEYGGGSNTLLQFNCPYSTKATREFLKLPDLTNTFPLVGIRATSLLAHRAYERWAETNEIPERFVSVACTASLVKPGGESSGRIHKAVTSYVAFNGTQYYEGMAEHFLPSTATRERQEILTAIHTLRAIEDAMDLTAETGQQL